MAQDIPLAQEILHRALSPSEADARYTDTVVKRPLYLRPTSPEPSARAIRRRALNEKKEKARKRKTLKPRPLSAAQKRKLGLFEIPKEQVKWDIYLPLHELWLGYMREILAVGRRPGGETYITAASSGLILCTADMHGAMLEVVRSRCVSRVGLKGIVVRDSKHIFEVVTEGNALKSIPKEHTMFRLEVSIPAKDEEEVAKPLVFEIMGDQFQDRPANRANKKHKMHYQPYI